MTLALEKTAAILACPRCKQAIIYNSDGIHCHSCSASYSVLDGLPILINESSEVLQWYRPHRSHTSTNRPTWKTKARALLTQITPEERVWTRKSQRVLREALRNKNPDAPDSTVILIGAGFESVFERLLQPYQSLIRVGLAQRGEIDIACDICDLPFVCGSADMIFSSSVLEHVYDPERATAEMRRVLKPGGYVYAEIPFMRAYHMEPIDYQRYTISGIERLFARHGFQLIDKGICSGPFTGGALFIFDFLRKMFASNRYLSVLAEVVLANLLHPMKFLDRLFENSKWAETNACNFYYFGAKA